MKFSDDRSQIMEVGRATVHAGFESSRTREYDRHDGRPFLILHMKSALNFIIDDDGEIKKIEYHKYSIFN